MPGEAKMHFGLYKTDAADASAQGRLWAGDTDHPDPSPSGEQLHRQHQRECQCAHDSRQLEPVPRRPHPQVPGRG